MTSEVPGHNEPYTMPGIRNAKCVRCGNQAVHQWHACADKKWRPVCLKCDIALNRLILDFMFPDDPNGNDKKIKRYTTSQEQT